MWILGELHLVPYEEGFDRFFRGLLGVKAEVLKVDFIANLAGKCQVAAGRVEPFSRIIGWEALRFRHDRPPDPRAVPA